MYTKKNQGNVPECKDEKAEITDDGYAACIVTGKQIGRAHV